VYRIRNAQGKTVFRTDLYSRDQIGRGSYDPNGAHYAGDSSQLDGTKSCSVVRGDETIVKEFAGPSSDRIPEAEFWQSEFGSAAPVPRRIEDLIIYELHVNALGAGKNRAGNLQDAMDLLPHLSDLGINAVELLPMAEFSGGYGWGYGDSHYFVIESSAGTRDQYKHFIRACHRRGIAVIQDVCFNHYDFNAARAQWQYDSEAPNDNNYYWYEGLPSDYRSADGGYVDNGSSGYAPRYWEEMVRQLFIGSAVAFIENFHVDGFRVDLTEAIHRDNALHADGRSLGNANLFGQKLLREWCRTLRLIRPSVMLIAEDHSGWDAVTKLPEAGGLGFDSTWFVSYYHNLIGDSEMAGGYGRLVKAAGFGGDEPLGMEQFSGDLYATKFNKVIYTESHDEAGNAPGTQRTIVCAVNGAPLVGPTRDFAEARCRVAFGLSLLSAATPMFFMGEEVGAQKPYRFNDFLQNREDIAAERNGTGARLFGYYQDLIRFSRRHAAIRSQDIDIIHVIGSNRLIAFTRLAGTENLLVVASLRNEPFLDGYVIQTDAWRLPDGSWREIFNSDATVYGGNGIGNFGADVPARGGRLQVRVPANGLLIFQKL
jgi:1,4-alpha-glucan branching enzyme